MYPGIFTSTVLNLATSMNAVACAAPTPMSPITNVPPVSLNPIPARVGVGINSSIVTNGWKK